MTTRDCPCETGLVVVVSHDRKRCARYEVGNEPVWLRAEIGRDYVRYYGREAVPVLRRAWVTHEDVPTQWNNRYWEAFWRWQEKCADKATAARSARTQALEARRIADQRRDAAVERLRITRRTEEWFRAIALAGEIGCDR